MDMCGELSYGDRVKSEICDHGEYRKIVIDLRVESISCDIEIVREHLDHRDRYKCCYDLGSDLGQSVGIYFLSGHDKKYREKGGSVKIGEKEVGEILQDYIIYVWINDFI
jgi:hypothetical protein